MSHLVIFFFCFFDAGVGYSPGNTRVSSVDSNSDTKECVEDPSASASASTSSVSFMTNFSSNVKSRTGALPQLESIKFSGSGNGGDSTCYSGLNFFLKSSPGLASFTKRNMSMYSWSVEYCILHSQKYAEQQGTEQSASASKSNSENSPVEERQLSVKCPKHGDILLKEICPDILFLDLNSRYLLQNPCVQRGNLLGKELKI